MVTYDALGGRPAMIFIAGTTDLSHIVFGANGTAWGELTAVSAITRAARDTRHSIGWHLERGRTFYGELVQG
ncbi:hypothetical protein GGI35DRAFT_442157 [Trichoderma velutinum]